MATKRRRKNGRSSKTGNEKLIAAIITVLLAIFGFAYNGVNSGFGKKRAKTSNSKKNTASRSTNTNYSNSTAMQNIPDVPIPIRLFLPVLDHVLGRVLSSSYSNPRRMLR